MKLLLITSSLLLLTSCTNFKYTITYETCDGQSGSITKIGWHGPSYAPEFKGACKYFYTREEIK